MSHINPLLLQQPSADQLQEQVWTLSDELDNAKGENETLSEKIEIMQGQLDSKNRADEAKATKIEKLSATIRQLRQENRGLIKRLRGTNDSVPAKATEGPSHEQKPRAEGGSEGLGLRKRRRVEEQLLSSQTVQDDKAAQDNQATQLNLRKLTKEGMSDKLEKIKVENGSQCKCYYEIMEAMTDIETTAQSDGEKAREKTIEDFIADDNSDMYEDLSSFAPGRFPLGPDPSVSAQWARKFLH